MAEMLEQHTVYCPYCGESFEASIDLSAGAQNYIEDCYVCCRPIQFQVEVDHNSELVSVQTQRDDD